MFEKKNAYDDVYTRERQRQKPRILIRRVILVWLVFLQMICTVFNCPQERKESFFSFLEVHNYRFLRKASFCEKGHLHFYVKHFFLLFPRGEHWFVTKIGRFSNRSRMFLMSRIFFQWEINININLMEFY